MDVDLEERHIAKRWVEANFPELGKGPHKAALILAYGAGYDRAMVEAEQLVAEAIEETRVAMNEAYGVRDGRG